MSKGVTRANRSNDAELERRVTEVQKALLNGHTRSSIQNQFKSWGIADRTLDTYIAMAKDKIREINDTQREDNLAMITTNLWEMFVALKNSNELDDARKVLMDIAKLRGLDEQVVKHFVSERPLSDISDEELDAVITAGNGRH